MSSSTADDEQITIRDIRGASLVAERTEGGRLVVWIAAPGESDGQSVALNDEALDRLAEFLRLRRVEPAVDHDGDEVWLDKKGRVEFADERIPAEEGWRRLYVEPRLDGGEPA